MRPGLGGPGPFILLSSSLLFHSNRNICWLPSANSFFQAVLTGPSSSATLGPSFAQMPPSLSCHHQNEQFFTLLSLFFSFVLLALALITFFFTTFNYFFFFFFIYLIGGSLRFLNLQGYVEISPLERRGKLKQLVTVTLNVSLLVSKEIQALTENKGGKFQAVCAYGCQKSSHL